MSIASLQEDPLEEEITRLQRLLEIAKNIADYNS